MSVSKRSIAILAVSCLWMTNFCIGQELGAESVCIKNQIESQISAARRKSRISETSGLSVPLSRIRKPYHLDSEALGEGLFGRVFRGTMPIDISFYTSENNKIEPGAAIAIKVPYASPPNIGSVRQEGQWLEQISRVDPKHRFVRGAWDTKRGILITEFVSGEHSLDDFSPYSDPKINDQMLSKWIGQLREIGEVLLEAHVVHSDLQPQNIRITSDYNLEVIDFSLAAAEGSYPPHLGGNRFGNAAYSTKNQQLDGAASHEDDLYALHEIESRLIQLREQLLKHPMH